MGVAEYKEIKSQVLRPGFMNFKRDFVHYGLIGFGYIP